MKKTKIPFYANPDSMSCHQASFRMILEHFKPQEDWSWNRINNLTGHRKDKATWHMKGIASLAELGFEVLYIEDFDCEKFVNEKDSYIRETNNNENAISYILAHTDFEFEKDAVNKLIKLSKKGSVKLEVRSHNLEDIFKYLDEGYLVCYWVNSKFLNNKPGYSGHLIAAYGYDEKVMFAHDPGWVGDGVLQGAFVAREIPLDIVMDVSDAGGHTGGFTAIRLRK